MPRLHSPHTDRPAVRQFIGTGVALGGWVCGNARARSAVKVFKEEYVTDANILLVDDDAQFVDIMRKRLTMRSMEVFHAGSGEEAMQKLASHGEIEVVILDVKLPGCSGIEVLRLIKQQYPLVEVIMLTGNATVESAIDGLRLGAWDYLMKPCGIDVLVEKVKEAVEKKRRHEEKIVDARVREIASRRG